tara:strand:- start:770 stop:1105 length:336 start_codon:yes stop_codon:yes gene_type:complete
MKAQKANALRKGYLIIPLAPLALRFFDRIAHRKTQLPIGKKTDTHKHRLFSFYIVENMACLQTPYGELPLPRRALVVVMPFITHGWSNHSGQTEGSFVYDLTPMHGPHHIL